MTIQNRKERRAARFNMERVINAEENEMNIPQVEQPQEQPKPGVKTRADLIERIKQDLHECQHPWAEKIADALINGENHLVAKYHEEMADAFAKANAAPNAVDTTAPAHVDPVVEVVAEVVPVVTQTTQQPEENKMQITIEETVSENKENTSAFSKLEESGKRLDDLVAKLFPDAPSLDEICARFGKLNWFERKIGLVF